MKKLSVLALIICILFVAIINAANVEALGITDRLSLNQQPGFLENKGQVTDQGGNNCPEVKYIYAAPGFRFILKKNSFSYEEYSIKENSSQNVSEASGLPAGFRDNCKISKQYNAFSHRVDVKWSGANPDPEILAENATPVYYNFYLAGTPEEGINKVFQYQKVTYKNVWPGIDIVFCCAAPGSLKYNLVLHPGATMNDITFCYYGMNKLSLKSGNLKIFTSKGWITENIPGSFLSETGDKVAVGYQLKGSTVQFKGRYDVSKTLVIDPGVIWATYLGGTAYDQINAIATDNSNVYFAGSTLSTSYIATSGAYQTTYAGNGDALLGKFNAQGQLNWCTYYGGSSGDEAFAIALDGSGNLYMAGHTLSGSGIGTSGAYQSTYAGGEEGFFAKFDLSGTRKFGTYYGGNSYDDVHGITTDATGNIYITGITMSSAGIATSGSYQSAFGGNDDAYIAKFNPAGVRKWATYIGGSSEDFGYAITSHKDALYITGYTISSSGIASSGAFQTSLGGFDDAFIEKLDTSGKMLWGTYFGGSGRDYGRAITTDAIGNVFLGGFTPSSSGIATTGAFQTSLNGSTDAFLAKFDATGSLLWGTYYGGSYGDAIYGLCTDNSGNVYATGGSGGGASLVTSDAYQKTGDGPFIAIFTSSGSLKYATFYGGTKGEYSFGLCLDNSGHVYFAGYTFSPSGISTFGSYQDNKASSVASDYDAYIAKFTFEKYDRAILATIVQPLICAPDSVPIKIVFKNNSSFTDSNFVIRYFMSGQTITEEVIKTQMKSGDQDTFTLKKKIYFATGGVNTFKVYLGLQDENPANDTITINKLTAYKSILPVFYQSGSFACNKTTTSFYESSVLPSGYSIVKRFWDFGDGDTITGNGSTVRHVFAKAGTYPIKLTITSDKGCLNNRTINFNINPTPEAGFYITRPCSGTLTGFNDTSKGTSINYLWNFGDGSGTISAQNTTHKYNTIGTYNVQLIVTSSSGCSDTAAKKTEIFPVPKPGFIVSQLCLGSNTVFKDTSAIAAGFLISGYNWHFGDGDSSAIQNPVHLFGKTGTYNVNLKTTGSGGCSDTVTRSVKVYDVPVAKFLVAKPGCQSKTISFSNTSAVTGTATYSWHFGTGDSSALKSPGYSWLKPGVYHITLKTTTAGPCSSLAQDSILINPTPQGRFNIISSKDPNITFVPVDSTLFSYQWNFGDGKTAASAKAIHIYTHNGIYTVTLKTTNKQGCDSLFSEYVNITDAGIEPVNSTARWNIFPNPVHDGVVVLENSGYASGRKYIFKLFDINGACVFSILPNIGGIDHIILPNTIRPGIYEVMILDNNQTYCTKLMIE